MTEGGVGHPFLNSLSKPNTCVHWILELWNGLYNNNDQLPEYDDNKAGHQDKEFNPAWEKDLKKYIHNSFVLMIFVGSVWINLKSNYPTFQQEHVKNLWYEDMSPNTGRGGGSKPP